MAYLRDLVSTCQALACSKRAVVQLVSCRNDLMGRYCRACGKRALEKLNKDEKVWFS